MADRFEISLEILKFLLQKSEFVTTSEIHEYLYRRGFFENLSPRGKERRQLNRVLGFLESKGYVESKYIEPKGRVPQEWKINEKAFSTLIHLSEEELISLLTFIAFIPNSYKELSIFKPTLGLVNRLSEKIDSEKKKIIEESFSYEPQFLEKFVPLDDEIVKKIHNAILNKKALIVSYKGSNYFKLFPIKIFLYNGILYLGGIDGDKIYRTYYLGGLKVIEILDESISEFLRKKYKGINFAFEDENPFLFGLKIYFRPGIGFFKNFKMFPTQFFMQKRRDYYLVYLVGYTGSRFTSRFLVEEIKEILPPSVEIINKAKEINLKKEFPFITFSLKENRKRFRVFIEEFEEFLKQRIEALKKVKRLSL
jgi:hypothetical protein